MEIWNDPSANEDDDEYGINENDEEQFTDSEEQKSDHDQFYLPSAETDPTQNWVGFHDAIGGQVLVESCSEDSVELSSGPSEDETIEAVGGLKKKSRCVYNDKIDMSHPIFEVGMMFPDAKTVKRAIKEHAIKTHRSLKLVKNDKQRIRARCAVGCPWTLLASLESGSNSFVIKTLNQEHGCSWDFSRRKVGYKWLCKKYLNQFRAQSNWSFEGFKQQVKEDTLIDISKWQFYKARKHAQNIIHGSVVMQYGKLWDYAEELKKSNPGSTVKIKCYPLGPNENENPKFMRMYICMAGTKSGWLAGCRPIIGLDGCFVKGPFKGQLLCAVGMDPNNAIYPIAYALVESECYESWTWFLELLKDDLNIVQNVTWISDRQKGLLEAVKTCFGEEAPHRFCVRHLYNNFKVHHRGLNLKMLIWNAARSTVRSRFEEELKKLKEVSSDAWEWISKVAPKHWTRSHFSENSGSDLLLNNLCESFNGVIVDARDKPIITLMEMVRCYMMKRIQAKNSEVSKWKYLVGPHIQKIIESNKLRSVSYMPSYSGDLAFQVVGMYGDQYVVDLKTKKYACRRWCLNGVPCAHAIACISQRGLNIYDFVHENLTKKTYEKVYQHFIRPINGPELWDRTGKQPIECPEFKKQRGRPKKVRRKEPDEVRVAGRNTMKLKRKNVAMSCTKCGRKDGHNKATCGRNTSSGTGSQGRKKSTPEESNT